MITHAANMCCTQAVESLDPEERHHSVEAWKGPGKLETLAATDLCKCALRSWTAWRRRRPTAARSHARAPPAAAKSSSFA